MRFYGMTHTGKTRERNEDAFLTRHPLFAVADGMGGHKAGDVASTAAIATLSQWRPQPGFKLGELQTLVDEANRAVRKEAVDHPGAENMGTTLTVVAVVKDHRLLVAHVGDSRAYLWREGLLEQLTEDHSLVAELARQGQITEVEAESHPQRSVITRALGPAEEVAAELRSVEVAAGDKVLLCSDGLSSVLKEGEIARVLGLAESPKSLCARLIGEANERGGPDNITAVVLDFAPRNPRSLLRPFGGLLIVGALLWGALAFASGQYYLVERSGKVLLVQGINAELAGVSLFRRLEEGGVEADSLPDWYRERLAKGIRISSPSEGRSALKALEDGSAP